MKLTKMKRVEKPELVIGFTGPIGIDMEATADRLEKILKSFDYSCRRIKLTDEMLDIDVGKKVDESTYINKYNSLIEYANEVRRRTQLPDIMAVRAISAIRRVRKDKTGSSELPLSGNAYILRQLKRPEEVELLRSVYQQQFILVSVHETKQKRSAYIRSKCVQHGNGAHDDDQLAADIENIILRDENEDDDTYGQRLRETFPKGDVFITQEPRPSDVDALQRFFELLFGRNDISPTPDEQGMYLAKAASVRSVDLSRQVGATIISSEGEILALGCNEVPKSGGGTYWTTSDIDQRDYQLGYDPNDREKKRVLRDLLERLEATGYLKRSGKRKSDIEAVLKETLRVDGPNSVRSARLMDIIEFGRIIHAEMHALTEATRFGRAVSGATLFCTTFPCHLCAKHIVSSGIARVVYIEPYPKSYAYKLHSDAIELDEKIEGKVSFDPFLGIAPYRYRNLFETTKRKDDEGNFKKWKLGKPGIRLEIYIESHPLQEAAALKAAQEAVGTKIKPKRKSPPAKKPRRGRR